jgi:hypothetical protein
MPSPVQDAEGGDEDGDDVPLVWQCFEVAYAGDGVLSNKNALDVATLRKGYGP